MVAEKALYAPLPADVDAGVGVIAIADDVSEADELGAALALRVLEAGLEPGRIINFREI